MTIHKKLMATILAIGCTMSMAPTALAQQPPQPPEGSVIQSKSGVSLFWVETLSAGAELSASGKTLRPGANVRANNTSTKITGTLYLEKYLGGSWKPVTSWSVSGTGSLKTNKSYTGTAGTEYRTRIVVTVGSERIERTSSTCKI